MTAHANDHDFAKSLIAEYWGSDDNDYLETILAEIDTLGIERRSDGWPLYLSESIAAVWPRLDLSHKAVAYLIARDYEGRAGTA
jgi:hypothetical protein